MNAPFPAGIVPAGPAGHADMVRASVPPGPIAGAANVRDGRPLFDGKAKERTVVREMGATLAGRSADLGPLALIPSTGFPRVVPDSGAEGLRGGGAADLLEIPSPRRSGPLSEFALLDRVSLEQAIDRFLHAFDDGGAGLPGPQGGEDLLAEVAAVTALLAATKVVPRWLARARGEQAARAGAGPDARLDELAGLPEPWGLADA